MSLTKLQENKILETLNKYGDMQKAAEALGISYNTLYYHARVNFRKVTRWERRK